MGKAPPEQPSKPTNPPRSTRARARSGALSRLPQERLEQLADELRTCQPHSRIERKFAKLWKMSRRQVRNYLRRVYDDWHAQSEADRPYALAKIRAMLEEVIGRAIGTNDLKAAVAGIKEYSHIMGVYPDTKLTLGGAVEVAGAVDVADPDAVRARLRELAARHAAELGLKGG